MIKDAQSKYSYIKRGTEEWEERLGPEQDWKPKPVWQTLNLKLPCLMFRVHIRVWASEARVPADLQLYL